MKASKQRDAKPPSIVLGHWAAPDQGAHERCARGCRRIADRWLAVLVEGDVHILDLCTPCAQEADERPLLQLPGDVLGGQGLEEKSAAAVLYGRFA